MENLTGKQLGPYQVIAPLGEGGMAAVYRAYQPSMDRYVALKVLPRYFAGDPQFVGRFEQEAKVLAKLLHPHILPVHDYGEADGYTYIVMPFVESGTLADLLTGEPLPLAQIRRVITQIGSALDYAHSMGLVHRDVKPSNILIDPSGNCLLTDFGIAKMVESTAQFTRTGGIVGTPAYMSPEQIQGEELDGRSDIYSLGIVLYEVATGRPPYRAETPPAIFVKHLHDPLPPPRTLNPVLPEAVERVILKTLAKKREDRFTTAGDVARALEAAIETTAAAAQAEGFQVPEVGETAIIDERPPVTSAQPSIPTSVSPAEPSRPSRMWILAGIGVVIVVAAVIGLAALGSWLTGTLGGGGETGDVTAARAVSSPVATPVAGSGLTDTPAAGQSAPSATPVPPEPSPTPEATTPTFEPSMTGLAKINPTNLFSGPGEEYRMIGAIEEGTKVALLGRNAQGDWLKIRSEQGTGGWVSADQIDAHMPIMDIPLAAGPPATPTRPRPTNTPTSVVVPEPTPTATSLPGAETVPLANLAPSIPWLPLDESAVPATYYYSFNLAKPPFDNRLVRQAFALAVDRQMIVDIAKDRGSRQPRPATTFTPPEVLGRDLYGQVGLPFDPARARELLAQAGYPNGEGFPEVTLVFNYQEGHEAIANAVVAMWRDHLGVSVGLESVDDWDAYLERLATDAPPVFRLGWAADYNDPDNFLMATFHSTSDQARVKNFANAQFDRLVEQAAAASDPATRQALYIQAERILCEQEAAVIPIYYYSVEQ